MTGNLSLSDNGNQYRAIFTNMIGSIVTQTANLVVDPSTAAPSITTQPTNQSANTGSTATFFASASGKPEPTVKWQLKTPSVDWTDITGANTTSYTTPALTDSDNGNQYRAIFTNGISSDATTDTATLSVINPHYYSILVSTNSPVTYGSTVILTAKLIQSGDTFNSGSVSFYCNNLLLGTGDIYNDVASYVWSGVAAGNYANITASGNVTGGTYIGSNTATVLVNQADLTISAANTSKVYGSALTEASEILYASMNDGTIVKYDVTSGISTSITNSKTVFARLSDPTGIAFDSSGNLFAANYWQNGPISKITPSGSVSDLASGMNYPVGVAVDASGNIYSANSGDGTISKISQAGLTTVFVSGLNFPCALVFDRYGNLYSANARDNAISKITPSGIISTFATGLSAPYGMVFDNSDNLYVANYWDNGGSRGNTISKITPDGNVSQFASGLVGPESLAFDPSGFLYVTNNLDKTISKYHLDGTLQLTFSSGGSYPRFIAFPPSLSYAHSTLYNGDTISVSETSEGISATANVGTYNIAVSNATFINGSASNYNITYNNATLLVKPADLTISLSIFRL
jgi:sugar lactone lactonase YvrE